MISRRVCLVTGPLRPQGQPPLHGHRAAGEGTPNGYGRGFPGTLWCAASCNPPGSGPHCPRAAGAPAAAAAARGHHHGRQRTLGGAAWAPAPGGAPRGSASVREVTLREAGGPGGPDAVRLLLPELGAARRGGRGADGAAARLPRARARGDPRQRHPPQRHRRGGAAAALRARAAGAAARGEAGRTRGWCSPWRCPTAGARSCAARGLAEAAARGEVGLERLEPRDLERFLWTSGLPPVDLIVRTSGEYRLSNFLLWQAAYAARLHRRALARLPDGGLPALAQFQQRERRFGLTSAQVKCEEPPQRAKA